jgi:hypothetical protein
MYDNFYATGTSSGDGHQWATQANETAYCLWPGYAGRSYPFEGSDPLAPSSSGFIWDLAAAKDRTVAIFGEYSGREANVIRADRPQLMTDRHKLTLDGRRRFFERLEYPRPHALRESLPGDQLSRL